MRDEVKFYTVDQAAEILGLKAVTIRSWIAKRALGHVKLGRRAIRVPETEIQRLVNKGFVPSQAERAR